jgi:beta-barrel assembly-enhancing protease
MIGKRKTGGSKVRVCMLSFVMTTCISWTALAQTDEEKVGEVAAARIMGAAPLIEIAAAQRYLNLVGHSVAKINDGGYKWRFGLLKTDSVNAFATPGGFVLVTAGLVKQLESEDELAFVLAHEIAHVLRRHHYRVVIRQRLAETAAKNVQAATGDTTNAALSQASAQIYARGLDKSSEFEADRLGVELMTQAGYDPAAAVGVLERLQRLKGDDPRAELLFSTHPSPAKRLDTLLESGVDSLPRPSTSGGQTRNSRFQQFQTQF